MKKSATRGQTIPREVEFVLEKRKHGLEREADGVDESRSGGRLERMLKAPRSGK